MNKFWSVVALAIKQENNVIETGVVSGLPVGTEEHALGWGHKGLEEECPKKDGWNHIVVRVISLKKDVMLKLLETVDE